MEPQNTAWIKKEETDEIYLKSNHMYLEDSLEFEEPDVDVTQVLEINMDIDASDHIEVGPMRCRPDRTRSIKTIVEAHNMLDETCQQGETNQTQETTAEKSTHIVGEVFCSQDNILCATNIYYFNENEHEDFICSLCMQRFSSKYNLTMHVFIHIDGVEPPEHICTLCGEVFFTDNSLNEHFMMHSGISWEEYQNSRILNDFNSHQYCEMICAHKRPQVFDFHNKLLTVTNNLSSHRSDVNGKPATPSCFIDNNTIIQSNRTSRRCDVCGKTFSQYSDLKKHVLIHTGIRPHRCGICGKSFTQSGSLKKHALIHSGEKPHKCNVCGKCFNRSATLKNHSLIHTGEKPHKCDVCGKSFTHRSTLSTHALIHSGKRPHKCNVCGKSFTSCGDLKKHSSTHTGVRLYKCDICGKSFTQSSSLRMHALTHTDDRPHKCKECGKCFSHHRYLKIHSSIHTRQ